ncbi:methyltransferase, FxLD system [Salinactinospora qingdaonensis]|uniref:Protein-L-isoaspartate O-methyltransferase n=1 Tax=Salinactinospora qingdaonensis TaxID=702744 RepID=A0ABP7GEC2_9ACTN
MNTAHGSDTRADEAAAENSPVSELREAMITELRDLSALTDARVEGAFRSVERHRFTPGVSLEVAYAANSPVITDYDDQGQARSAISAASIQATMLEQADIRPGMRVLEIGSGGYNAALIRELVGPTGRVVTLDIDPAVVERARACLHQTGYDDVSVRLGDAEEGVADTAPYDRILVTVGAWDIPPAWIDQLAADGRIVVALRMRGATRSVVFEREDDHLVSRQHHLCGFVPIQGIGAHTERRVAIDGDEVVLRTDDDAPIDADRLRAALGMPRLEQWTGVELTNIGDLDLYLATMIPTFGLLTASHSAVQRDVVSATTLRGAPTSVSDDGFAYRIKRRSGGDHFELGVHAYGPDAAHLAEEYTELIRAWYRDHCHGPGARIRVYPAGTTPLDLDADRLIPKKHTHVHVSWN